jgi:hypothetical protein
MAGNGQFAVAWSSYNASLNSSSTYMRLYQSNGTPLTGAVAVFTGTSTASGVLQGIAMDSAGDFAVMYGKSAYSKQWGWNTAAMTIQRYTSTGASNGSAISAGTPNLINGHQAMAMDANGNFVIVWDDSVFSRSGRTMTTSVYAQLYTAAGKKNGSQITVVSSSDIVWQSSVAMTHDGRFVVGWEHRVLHNNPDGSVYYDFIGNAQLFTASGARSGSALVVTISNAVEAPLAIGYDDAGNVTFSYGEDRSTVLGTSYVSGSGEVLYRRLNAAGQLGPESIVNTTTQGGQFGPGIVATGNGKFVVAWQGNGPGDSQGIFAQRFAGGPQIGTFSDSNVSSVLRAGMLTLSASSITDPNAGATITQVAFYATDSAGNQYFLGYGTNTGGVWSVTFTINLNPGSYTLFAEATDSYGTLGADSSLVNLTVI